MVRRKSESEAVATVDKKNAEVKPKAASRIRTKRLTPLPFLFTIAVQYACKDDALPSRYKVKRWASKAVLNGHAEVTVRFVDAEEGLTLNHDFRGRDYATNVLSFPYVPVPDMAGDLVLCVPVVMREAKEQNKPVEAHFAHLIVHGMLHLQGFDHETNERDAEVMEAQERIILAELGFPDPYAGER